MNYGRYERAYFLMFLFCLDSLLDNECTYYPQNYLSNKTWRIYVQCYKQVIYSLRFFRNLTLSQSILIVPTYHFVQFMEYLSNSCNICPIHGIFVQFMELFVQFMELFVQFMEYSSNSWNICPIHGIIVQFMEYLSNSWNICPIH